MIAYQLDDGIARLTLSVPPLNILTRAVLLELRTALGNVQQDTSVRVLLLAAEGKHFSAGASVEEHMPPEHDRLLADFGATVLALYDFPIPVIAAVQGRCLGGGFELVQAADMIVAAEDAQFAQPEILLGVFAPVACALLPRRVGAARAAELLFTGDPLNAQEAAAAGLVTRVVPRQALEEEALVLARRMARHSAVALRLTKQALRAAAGASAAAGIASANSTYTQDLMRTFDALEGLHAFVQKRPPQWSHQ
jgi:cyclohexa-1,5-dienecarbonyl-CoA hydratase